MNEFQLSMRNQEVNVLEKKTKLLCTIICKR